MPGFLWFYVIPSVCVSHLSPFVRQKYSIFYLSFCLSEIFHFILFPATNATPVHVTRMTLGVCPTSESRDEGQEDGGPPLQVDLQQTTFSTGVMKVKTRDPRSTNQRRGRWAFVRDQRCYYVWCRGPFCVVIFDNDLSMIVEGGGAVGGREGGRGWGRAAEYWVILNRESPCVYGSIWLQHQHFINYYWKNLWWFKHYSQTSVFFKNDVLWKIKSKFCFSYSPLFFSFVSSATTSSSCCPHTSSTRVRFIGTPGVYN